MDMTERCLPAWIESFVEDQLLNGLEAQPVERQKRVLYGIGRIPREAVRPYVARSIPKQSANGRYLLSSRRIADVITPAAEPSDDPDPAPSSSGVITDEKDLWDAIRTAQQVQEDLSNILHQLPARPFTFLPVWTPYEIEQRIRARDWRHFAWGAGSHTGSDIKLLYMNVCMGLEAYRPALDGALSVCGALQNAEDGMWGYLDNEPHQRVNGTMKVLSKVYFVLERHLPFSDKMIDYVLNFTATELPGYVHRFSGNPHALVCTIIDILFCLEYANRMTDHRRADIASACFGLFPLLDDLRKEKGTTIGLVQGSIRRAAALCGLREALGWPEKVYRLPLATSPSTSGLGHGEET